MIGDLEAAFAASRAEDQRFIPVRADEVRILTCFLEYHAAHVTVHDDHRHQGWLSPGL
jgi:hypothetical protein